MCDATLRVDDPVALAKAVDDAYARDDEQTDGTLVWYEHVITHGMQRIRAHLELGGDQLHVHTNSAARFEDSVLATVRTLAKHFCSGAKGSDLLLVFGVVQDDSPQQGAIIAAVIPTSRHGVQVNDDWAAIGMRQTDSGSTEFHNVKVEPDEVLGAPNAFILAFIESERGSLFAPIVQLIFANVYLGIAHGALDAAREYTRTQARPCLPNTVSTASGATYAPTACTTRCHTRSPTSANTP